MISRISSHPKCRGYIANPQEEQLLPYCANGQNEVLTGISLSQTDKADNKCHLAAIQEIGFRDRHMDLKNKHWVLWKGNYKDCSVSKEKQCGALELWSFCSALNGAFFQHEV